MLIKSAKPNLKIYQPLCIFLMLAVAFAGVRLLLSDLTTPAHLHGRLIGPSVASAQAHEHHHSSVSRHMHEASVRSFEIIVTIDHETGDSFNEEKSVSKISFDCDLALSGQLDPLPSRSVYSVIKMTPLSSVVAPRADRPPIYS
jgi:hypothetical protein